jgi:hypothetical protein
MGFIDDNEIRAGACEALPTPFGLDVVKADDREWVSVEQGLSEGQAAFQPAGGTRCDGDSFDPETRLEFPNPLLNQMRRAENGERVDLSPIHQLT